MGTYLRHEYPRRTPWLLMVLDWELDSDVSGWKSLESRLGELFGLNLDLAILDVWTGVEQVFAEETDFWILRLADRLIYYHKIEDRVIRRSRRSLNHRKEEDNWIRQGCLHLPDPGKGYSEPRFYPAREFPPMQSEEVWQKILKLEEIPETDSRLVQRLREQQSRYRRGRSRTFGWLVSFAGLSLSGLLAACSQWNSPAGTSPFAVVSPSVLSEWRERERCVVERLRYQSESLKMLHLLEEVYAHPGARHWQLLEIDRKEDSGLRLEIQEPDDSLSGEAEDYSPLEEMGWFLESVYRNPNTSTLCYRFERKDSQ